MVPCSFGNLPWPVRAALLLIVAGFSLLSPSERLLAKQPPVKKAIFQGKWDGKYEDNQRHTGEGEYEFHEDMNGRLTVTVTWGNPK